MNEENQSRDLPSPGRRRAQLTHLATIAVQIKEEDKKVQAGLQHSLKHAIKAGQLLSQCKKMIGHGGWLEWFESSDFPFKERTAQRYMSIYQRWKEIAAKVSADGNPSSLTDLTFTDALELLAQKEKSMTKRAIANTPKALAKTATADETIPFANSSQGVALHEVTELRTQASRCSDNWLTPEHIIGKVVQAFGPIDLDPAADDMTRIDAKMHYTASDNGLDSANRWQGSVYLNPPLAPELLGQFTGRLRAEFNAGHVTEAILIVPAMTDADWFRGFADCARVFLAKQACGSIPGMPNPLVAIYLGQQEQNFFAAFQSMGDGYVPYRPAP